MNSIDILVPDLPESVVDATVVKWHKNVGDNIMRDEVIVEIETDKIVLEIPAIDKGILDEILVEEGTLVHAHQVIARMRPQDLTGKQVRVGVESNVIKSESVTQPEESAQPEATSQPAAKSVDVEKNESADHWHHGVSPSVRRLLAEKGLRVEDLPASTKPLTAQDVEQWIAQKERVGLSASSEQTAQTADSHRIEKRLPMSRLRQRVAERLLAAKNDTAMLTTFNEVNMAPIMALRKTHGPAFEKRHGVRLGYMSFYLKAVVEALKRYPEINASIDGNDIVYHNYFDISIAISTPRGLVTPVLRDIDAQSMADLEKMIIEYGQKGKDGKLTVDDLTGGTFTISNGGVFGSLMSTPIINPPQSAILGMHAIKDRPMAVDGQVVILPMMYLALSYDHRIVDGKESIGFLLTVKEMLEEPVKLLLDI